MGSEFDDLLTLVSIPQVFQRIDQVNRKVDSLQREKESTESILEEKRKVSHKNRNKAKENNNNNNNNNNYDSCYDSYKKRGTKSSIPSTRASRLMQNNSNNNNNINHSNNRNKNKSKTIEELESHLQELSSKLNRLDSYHHNHSMIFTIVMKHSDWCLYYNKSTKRIWNHLVGEASTPIHLMTTLVLLQACLSPDYLEGWYTSFRSSFASNYLHILQTATLSNVALHLFLLDKALQYGKKSNNNNNNNNNYDNRKTLQLSSSSRAPSSSSSSFDRFASL